MLTLPETPRRTTTRMPPEAAVDLARFDVLYDEFATPVFNYCMRLTRCEAEAADATQNTFMKLAGKLSELHTREVSPAPYVFTIARNLSLELMRRRRRMSDPVPGQARRPGFCG